jgi:hypothetical protein
LVPAERRGRMSGTAASGIHPSKGEHRWGCTG